MAAWIRGDSMCNVKCVRGNEVRCRVRCVDRKLFICVAPDVDYKCRV